MSYCHVLICWDYEVDGRGACTLHARVPSQQELHCAAQQAIVAELTADSALLEDDPLAELCFEKFQKLGLTPKGSAVLRPYDFVFGPHTLTFFQYWVDSETPLWTRVYDQPLPKGGLAWKSGIYLANYLVDVYAAKDAVLPRTILELGSGIGLGGVCIDKLNKRRGDDWKLVLTDGDDSVLLILQVHLRLNRCHSQTSCAKLCWGGEAREFAEHHGQFELIIGADVVYEECSIRPLWLTVLALLSSDPQARFLLVQETRSDRLIAQAISVAEELGLKTRHFQHTAPQGLSAGDFVLLEVRR